MDSLLVGLSLVFMKLWHSGVVCGMLDPFRLHIALSVALFCRVGLKGAETSALKMFGSFGSLHLSP